MLNTQPTISTCKSVLENNICIPWQTIYYALPIYHPSLLDDVTYYTLTIL